MLTMAACAGFALAAGADEAVSEGHYCADNDIYKAVYPGRKEVGCKSEICDFREKHALHGKGR